MIQDVCIGIAALVAVYLVLTVYSAIVLASRSDQAAERYFREKRHGDEN